jgi:hypothetical protein
MKASISDVIGNSPDFTTDNDGNVILVFQNVLRGSEVFPLWKQSKNKYLNMLGQSLHHITFSTINTKNMTNLQIPMTYIEDKT